MSPFAPARPIGCRASGKQPITFESLPECTAEIGALARNELDPCLTPAAVKVLAASLHGLIMDVRSGNLKFTGEYPGGRVISRHDCIYELRPRQSVAGRLPTRELRMYCGEPQLTVDLCLGLHLATKPYGREDTRREQDSAIDEAVGRANAWELRKLRVAHDSARQKGRSVT